MILRTGNRNQTTSANPLRAFTLIELILVMAMLLTVIAVAAPSLSKFFRGRTLDSEARRFLSLTRYGQSRAVSEGVPVLLWIDAKEGTYGLQREGSYTERDSKEVEFALEKDLSFEVAKAQTPTTRLGSVGQLKQFGASVQTIRFQPDGFISETSPAGVWIREREGAEEKDELLIAQSRNRLNYEIQTNATDHAFRDR